MGNYWTSPSSNMVFPSMNSGSLSIKYGYCWSIPADSPLCDGVLYSWKLSKEQNTEFSTELLSTGVFIQNSTGRQNSRIRKGWGGSGEASNAIQWRCLDAGCQGSESQRMTFSNKLTLEMGPVRAKVMLSELCSPQSQWSLSYANTINSHSPGTRFIFLCSSL